LEPLAAVELRHADMLIRTYCIAVSAESRFVTAETERLPVVMISRGTNANVAAIIHVTGTG